MTVVERARRPRSVDEFIVDKLLKIINHLPVEELLGLRRGAKLTLVDAEMLGIVRVRLWLKSELASGSHYCLDCGNQMLAERSNNVRGEETRNALGVDRRRHWFDHVRWTSS
jgi:hypothetical protein